MARAATWVSILLAATFVAPVAGAQGRGGSVENDLALVETEVVGLEKRFAALRGEVSGGSLTRSPRLIAERYNEARYAYLVEDYERCALLFYSLIENEDLKGDARQPEAEWNLAECLFLDGNLLPAQSHFKRIVDKGATHSYHGDALLKLIEIYGRTGNVSQFNKYYNTFVRSSQDNSPTSLRIRYEMGKTMFFQDKLPEAQAIFAAFPRGSTYTPQARYFSGAILIEEGRRAARREDPDLATQKFRQGLVVFQEVLQLPQSTSEHRDVRDLCHLAIARLHYERGEVPAAIGSYSTIQSDSKFYADALYELIWANVESATQETIEFERTRRYDEALRAVEIFSLAFPDDVRDPALRLLAAHVRVKMEQFDEAIERYGEAAEHFSELKEVVEQIVASGADPMVYFNQLVDDERFIAEADLTVPAAARRKAQQDNKVAEAVRIASDLYRQQGDIEEADDLLDLLENALEESASKDLLQTYRLHRQQVSSTEAAGVLLRSRLVEVELAWLRENLPGNARGGLDSLVSQLDATSDSAEAMSRERQETLGRLEVIDLQAQAVTTRIYNVERMVQSLKERLTAVEEYLVDARARGERTREDEKEARAAIDEERRFLASVERSTRELRKRVSPRVLTSRLATMANADQGDRRADALAQLSATEARLQEFRRSAGTSDFTRKLDTLRGRLVTLASQSASLRERLDAAEADEIEAIKREVSFQRRMVTELDAEGVDIAGDNTRVSGRIGTQAFRDVAYFYEDMLTRADMGVADVYWYRKESLSKEKITLARERTKRLRGLQDAFRDVLGEVQ